MSWLQETRTRRGLFGYTSDNLLKIPVLGAAASVIKKDLLPHLSPDKPRWDNPEPGVVARHADLNRYYYIKTEKDDSGNEQTVGYFLSNYDAWKRNVGFTGVQTQMDAFNVYNPLEPDSKRVVILEPPNSKETVDFWDGSKKNYNENGGLKFVLIPGLFSSSRNTSSFNDLVQAIKEQGYDDGDILPMPYNIGFHHDKEDTMRDPEESFKNMSILVDRWKKEHPLDKFWLIGHSQGGYLAHKLAVKHKDVVAGVIAINGAIKGATISRRIPQPVEAAIERLLFDSIAGRFHIDRAGDLKVFFEVEKEVEELKRLGIIYISFSDFYDPITRTEDSHVLSSTNTVDGEQVLQFLTSPPWLGWRDLDFLPEWLTREAREFIGHHWAPLFDPLVKYYLQKVLIPPKPGHEEPFYREIEVVDVFPENIDPNTQGFGVINLEPDTQQPTIYLNQSIELTFNATVDAQSWAFGFSPPPTQKPHINFLHRKPNTTEIHFVTREPWKNRTTYTLIISPNFTTRGKAIKKVFRIVFTTNTFPYLGI